MSRALTRLRVLAARARRLPLRVRLAAAALLVAAVALLAAFLATGGGGLGTADYGAADASPAPYDGRSPSLPAAAAERVLVELPRPSLGARGGSTDPADQRAYVASLRQESLALVSALRARGVRLRDVVTFERAWHGFAATVPAADRPELESAGVRLRPVRRLLPQLSEPLGVLPEAVAPRDPGGRPVVALLAGGLTDGAPHLPGWDAVGRDRDPRGARDEAGGQPLADLLRGLGVRVRPIRVSGVQRVSELTGSEEQGRTDELLDGLEHAVDPDGDGAVDDQAAVAVIGVSSPYAGFADAPEAEAVRGARGLGMLVVTPAGAEGPAATGSSTVGSPGAGRAALATGPLVDAGAVARTTLTVGDVRVRRAAVLGRGTFPYTLRTAAKPVEATTAAALLGGDQPPLQGRVAIVRAGANPDAQAAAAAAAGAQAVVLARTASGPLPAMPAGRVPVPVVGVTGEGAEALLDAGGGRPARTRGLVAPRARPGVPFGRRPSPFSSAGTTFGGAPKPEAQRPGSVIAGGRLVSGGAVAAAVLGAQAAKLAGGPDTRQGLLTGTAAPAPSPTATPPAPAVPVSAPRVLRRGAATGVVFTVGTFRRGDAAAGQPTTVVPAARLVLTLQREGGGRVERLTPQGGERGVLPGEYAYTLRAGVVRRLAAGRYAFRVQARAPGQRQATDVVSPAFEAG